MYSTSFINEQAIWDCIEANRSPSPEYIDDILDKAAEAKGLSLAETAALLAPMPEAQENKLRHTAFRLKETIYGNRMVLFAPLYISNECANSCAYCAFSLQNTGLVRRSLNHAEIAQEVSAIHSMGHKRVLAVYGEHPKWNAEAIAGSVAAIYGVSTSSEQGGQAIRRANVNCAPLDVQGFSLLKEAGIGTYQCFQETYNQECYNKVHLGGKKRDYLWRLYAMHRAQEGGIDDVGMGVLFGLFDYRFDVLGLLSHAQELEKNFGVGPHTISVPRIEPAHNAPLAQSPPNEVSDAVFKRIVAVLRLAMPYTGMIITTRERAEIKRELLRLGISQLSAGSRTWPGAYAATTVNKADTQQFWVGDERSLADIIADLQDGGFIPSFCTGCYRMGRTGDHFMGLAKTAFIKEFCLPNAISSYAEYLEDYAPAALHSSGQLFIAEQLAALPDAHKRSLIEARLTAIRQGERDMFV